MKKLTVPENISLRKEAWRGFGWPEIVKSSIVTAVVLVLCIMYYVIHQGENDIVISVVVVVFTIAFCVGFFGKVSDTNQSIYDFLKKQMIFKKEQQVFQNIKRKEAYQVVQEESKD